MRTVFPVLILNLLGGFDARLRDGTPLAFSRKRAQALLAYLALTPGQAHPRRKLAALLWSDVPERSALAGLRQALVAIRRACPAGVLPLVSDAETVRLDDHRIEIDLLQFERLTAEGTAQALAAAVDVYRGPLLEGAGVQSAGFEEWLQRERERLHERAIEAFGRLLGMQSAAGELEAAVQTAARLLALDPLQETVHRTLMRLYARQGRRAAALRQYQACVDALQRELDAEPEAETKRVYRDILAAAPRASDDDQAPLGGRHSTRAVASSSPLIGRGPELARLTGALDSAVRRAGRAAVILGEAGIGKSRLIGEVAAAATARELHVFAGQAYESEQILPFGVWVQALRSGGLLTSARLDDLEPVWRAELARLFPELAPKGAHTPVADDPLRLFEAMARLLAHLARQRPVVVILEDLHWADSMSVRLLPFVVRRTASLPVLLIATAREEHLADTAGLVPAIDEIRQQPSALVIPLAPLSQGDTAALVSAHTGRAVHSADLDERVWRLSEGNPFVALEAVRALSGGDSPLETPTALPDRVRQMIHGRLARLGPAARRLADAAAVIGRDFDFRLLREAVGLDDAAAAEGLEELVRQRIVRIGGEHFAFTHDRLRHAVYADLLPPTRAALHHAVASAIERLYGDRLEEVYDRLVHHCTRTDDAERAVAYLAAFARQASRRYALDEAIASLAEARTHAARLPAAVRDRRLVELLSAEAVYLFYQGRGAELLDLLGRHEDLLARVPDPSPAGPCHVWLACTLTLAGQHAAAIAHAERAIAVAGRAGDSGTQGKGHAALSLAAFWSGAPIRGVAQARQAIELLAGGDDVEWLFYAHLYCAVNSIQLGELEAACEATRAASAVAERADSARLRTFAGWSTGWAAAASGDSAAAIEACRGAVALAPDPLGLANALGFLGYAYLEGGDAAAARTALADAVARAAEFGFRPQQGWFSAWLAEAHLAGGDVERARELARCAVDIGSEVGFPYGIAVASRAVGRVAAARGDVETAGEALRRALETFRAIPSRHEIARTEREAIAIASGTLADVVAPAVTTRPAGPIAE